MRGRSKKCPAGRSLATRGLGTWIQINSLSCGEFVRALEKLRNHQPGIQKFITWARYYFGQTKMATCWRYWGQ